MHTNTHTRSKSIQVFCIVFFLLFLCHIISCWLASPMSSSLQLWLTLMRMPLCSFNLHSTFRCGFIPFMIVFTFKSLQRELMSTHMICKNLAQIKMEIVKAETLNSEMTPSWTRFSTRLADSQWAWYWWCHQTWWITPAGHDLLSSMHCPCRLAAGARWVHWLLERSSVLLKKKERLVVIFKFCRLHLGHFPHEERVNMMYGRCLGLGIVFGLSKLLTNHLLMTTSWFRAIPSALWWTKWMFGVEGLIDFQALHQQGNTLVNVKLDSV